MKSNLYISIFFLLFLLLSCKKKETPVVIQVPTIVSLSPASGKAGDTITIVGTNFSSNLIENSVFINGVGATVVFSNVTNIKFIVPNLISNGQVILTTGGQKISGPTFSILFPPIIASINPKTGQKGDTITIAGTNFGNDIASNKVTMNGVASVLVLATSSIIKALVPNMQTSGAVQLNTSVGTANGGNFIYIIPPAPTITSVLPLRVTQGDTVTISGTNFSTSISGDSTTINGNKINLISATSSALKFVFNGITTQSGDYPFTIQVSTGGGTSNLQKTFSVYNDIYVAGYRTANSSGNKTAMYWKNGVHTFLTDGTNGAYAYGISVYGNDVYVVGSEKNANGILVAKFWKNGTSYPLSDGTKNVEANAIVISNTGDIHIVGIEGANSIVYWKNGNKVILNSSLNGYYPSLFLTPNNDLYIAGDNGYVKNGNFISYPSILKWGTSIYVTSSNDVYIAGERRTLVTGIAGNPVSVILKNGNVIYNDNIDAQNNYNSIWSIFIDENNNYYSCGFEMYFPDPTITNVRKWDGFTIINGEKNRINDNLWWGWNGARTIRKEGNNLFITGGGLFRKNNVTTSLPGGAEESMGIFIK